MMLLHYLNWPLLHKTDGEPWLTSEICRAPPPIITGDTWIRHRHVFNRQLVCQDVRMSIGMCMFHLFGVSSQLVSFVLTEHQVLCAHPHHKTQIQNRLLYLTSLTFKNHLNIHKAKDGHSSCPGQIPGQCYVIFIDLFSWTLAAVRKGLNSECLLYSQIERRTHRIYTHTRTSSSASFLLLLVVFRMFFPSGMLDIGGDTEVSPLPPLLCGHKKIFNGQINVFTSVDH